MKLFLRLLPILILTALVTGFFLPLFFPVPQIFISPDSTLSDILHFFYPTKFLLSESLKENKLPLWTDLVGTGFPLIAESQINALSFIILVLFKFFPLITAFNLQYVIIFLGLSIGMYVVAREFGWSKRTGLYCAIIYAFSGLHIVKIPHLNCLQALSYVPFIFWIILRMQKNKQSKLWLVLPILLSQQILQGHYQYVFMTYLFLGVYFYLSWWRNQKKDHPWLMKKILTIGLMSVGLSMAQLVPSLEYFLKSGGRVGLGDTAIGSFHVHHLLQFFYPYALGDNRVGTYPAPAYGLAFLETFSYIGLIPLLLSLASVWFLKKDIWIRNCWIIVALFFLFVFEKNSPMYVLFLVPPFSWFRVHSRFLAFITFILVLLSGYVFERIGRKCFDTFFVLFLFLVSIFDVISFASSYQPMLPVSRVETIPDSLKLYTHHSRMAAVPYNTFSWSGRMYTNGWKNPQDYLYLVNEGKPNYTILSKIPNLSIYAGYLPLKQMKMLSTALTTSERDEKEKTATLSAATITTLRLQNTGFLISPYTLSNPELTFVTRIQTKNSQLDPFNLYELSDVKPPYYLTDTYKTIRFVEQYDEEVQKPGALTSYDAFLTTGRTLVSSGNQGTFAVVSDAATQKIFSVSAPTDMFFVASVYLYPGWEAVLDNTKTPLVPANLSGMAVFISKGKHTLMLQFIPKSLYLGIGISIVTAVLYGVVIIRSVLKISS